MIERDITGKKSYLPAPERLRIIAQRLRIWSKEEKRIFHRDLYTTWLSMLQEEKNPVGSTFIIPKAANLLERLADQIENHHQA